MGLQGYLGNKRWIFIIILPRFNNIPVMTLIRFGFYNNDSN